MQSTTKISGKRTAKAPFDAAVYGKLLLDTLPTVITTVAQNRRMIKIVKKLMDKGENMTPEEGELLKLLGRLICDTDIVHIFGSRGITSEVINGKREISKTQAKALAKFFNTSTDLFL